MKTDAAAASPPALATQANVLGASKRYHGHRRDQNETTGIAHVDSTPPPDSGTLPAPSIASPSTHSATSRDV